MVEPVSDSDVTLAKVAGDGHSTRVRVGVHPSHGLTLSGVSGWLVARHSRLGLHARHTRLHSRCAVTWHPWLLHRHTRLHAWHSGLAVTRLLHGHTRLLHRHAWLTVSRLHPRHHSWLLHWISRLLHRHTRLLHRHARLAIHARLLHRHAWLSVSGLHPRHTHLRLTIHARLLHHSRLPVHTWRLIHCLLHRLLRNHSGSVLSEGLRHISCTVDVRQGLLS